MRIPQKLVRQCPICDGELQATQTRYLQGVTMNEEARFIHGNKAFDNDEFTIYCENGHTADEMRARIAELSQNGA